jgi:hypothetical protein
MSATPGHCGLCNVPSMFLQASQWGQVCRLCLRAKSRKAVRGASVPVQAPVEPQELPEGWREALESWREALREEGRQQGRQEERAAVQKELEAVARVLSRRDEPGSSIVAALLDWIQSRNEEGG